MNEVLKRNQIRQNGPALHTAPQVQPPNAPAHSEFPLAVRGLGNQAMQYSLRHALIQTKLKVSTPGDEYEQEADRVADAVMRMSDTQGVNAGPGEMNAPARGIQRMCSDCDEELQRQPTDEEDTIQAKELPGQTPAATPEVMQQVSAMRGGGNPLPDSVRRFFEPRFGHELSNVRVHTGDRVAETARTLRARAFTLGRDVAFGAGEYAPESSKGRMLLAHELTHVLQQTGGPVKPGSGFSAMQTTSRALRPPAFPVSPTRPLLQRDDIDDAVEASEQLGDEFRKERRGDLSDTVRDMGPPPMSTTDPARGFRLQDLQSIKSLTFKGSLSPLPAKAQSLLLGNIEATVRFVLDPTDKQRISQVAELRRTEKDRPNLPRFETPAERVDSTDLYHGHVCVPRDVLNQNAELQKLATKANPYRDRGPDQTIDEDIQQAIGKRTGPATRLEARTVTRVVERHRAPFLKILDEILQALVKVPEAVILYHTMEGTRPLVGGKSLDPNHPVRHIRTSLSNNLPVFDLTPDNPPCDPLINFSFHINRRGEITLLPGAVDEAVRAVEILFGWGTAPASTTTQGAGGKIQPKFLTSGMGPTSSANSLTANLLSANSLTAAAGDFLRTENSGQPLAESARSYFEPRFGRDLGQVRVHTDERADASARSLNALAYTAGNNIAFRAGAYAPATVPGKRLLAHELTHVMQQQSGDVQLQRQTVDEADMSVLRAALLDGIRTAHAFTSDQLVRTQLETLEAQIPTMTAAQLRAAIPGVQRTAQASQTSATSGDRPLTPSSRTPTLDPLQDDADLVIEESRNHQLYQLIQLLNTSRSFGATNIRMMLSQMHTDLNHVHWFANSDVGFAAATVLESVTGTPASAQIKVVIGPSMLILMNRPNEDMVPTLYHEIYHTWEQFRTQSRGSLPARPNLSQDEMTRRLGQLQGTSVAGDASFGTSALGQARSVESELFADLITHSGLQDPSVLGRTRTVGTSRFIVTLNNARTIQGQIEAGLQDIKLIFGAAEGRRIALALRARANTEALIHPNSRQMFQQLVDDVFPAP